MSVTRPLHLDCRAACNLLSTAEINHNLDDNNDASHERDNDASIHSDNSDDNSDVDACI